MAINGVLTGEIKRAGTLVENGLVFMNRSDFPPQGDSNKLYVATDENAIYRFSSGEYICCGKEYEEITAESIDSIMENSDCINIGSGTGNSCCEAISLETIDSILNN